MKLLTLNTHSLVEEYYYEKLQTFVQAVSEEQPDIIALQEVNQTITEMPVKIAQGYIPCAEGITIRQDNHIYHATEMLKSRAYAISGHGSHSKRAMINMMRVLLS